MSEERIDVKVTDSVPDGIAKKFNSMADGAERAETYIKRLKSALASVNTTAVDRLAAAMAKADTAQAKLLGAQARLTNAQNQGSIAAEKVALAQQKIATEAARTEAAQAKAAAATAGAESAAMRLAAAQQRLAGASNAAASATNASAAAATHAGAAYGAAAGGASRFGAAANTAAGASQRAGAAAGTMNSAYGNTVNATNQYARAQRTATAANANIIAQMQDIGVSLAGGQNPLLVAIQQGSQLSYIASTLEGGLGRLLTIIGGLLLKILPLTLVLGTLYLALRDINKEANDAAGLKEYAKTLGLTEKEVKKLKDVHVTMGDTIKATWQILSSDLLSIMGLTTEEIAGAWNWVKDIAIGTIKTTVVVIYALIKTLVTNIVKITENIAIAFYNAGVAAKNLFLKQIELLINGTVMGLNKIAEGVNWLSEAAGFGSILGSLEKIDLGVGSLTDGMKSFVAMDPLGDLGRNAMEADKYLSKLPGRIKATSIELAKARIASQAAEIIDDRTGKADPKAKVDKSAENRAHAIAMVNLQLDNELARMKLLKDERLVQQRMDQIEQSLAQKKITLNDAERLSIEGKVRAIEDYKFVQSELDRIYEETIAPQRTFNATLQAANELMAQGAISTSKYSNEVAMAGRRLAEATDPLFQMKEQMMLAEQGLKNYGLAAQQAAYYEQIRQAFLAKNILLSPQYVAGVNAEVDALMRKNAALQQGLTLQSAVSGTVGGILGPIQQDQLELENKAAYYAALEKMSTDYGLSEGRRIQARYALEAQLNEKRLTQASQFFGNLASLSQVGNKKIAMIGKAAAVAQATIDGVLAVQKALGSAPPPLNFALAAAAGVAAAVNVAKIVSTPVGGFAKGGQFMVEGKSGIDTNNINMDVTRGERVTVETAAQQRANDARTGGPTFVENKTKIINQFDEREFLAAFDSDEGEEIIINVMRRNGLIPDQS